MDQIQIEKLNHETQHTIKHTVEENTVKAFANNTEVQQAWLHERIQKNMRKSVKHNASQDNLAGTVEYLQDVIRPRRPMPFDWRALCKVQSVNSEQFQIRREEKGKIVHSTRATPDVFSFSARNSYYQIPMEMELMGTEEVDLKTQEAAGYDIQAEVLQALNLDFDIKMLQLTINKIMELNASGKKEARQSNGNIGTFTDSNISGPKFEKTLKVAKGTGAGSDFNILDINVAIGELEDRDAFPDTALMNPITKAKILNEAATASDITYNDMLRSGINVPVQQLDGKVDFIVSSMIPADKIAVFDSQRVLHAGIRRNKLVVPEVTPLMSKYIMTSRWGWGWGDTGALAWIE